MAHACSATKPHSQKSTLSRFKDKRKSSSLSCSVSILAVLLSTSAGSAADLVINNQTSNAPTGAFDNVIIGNTDNGVLQLVDGSTQTLDVANKLVFGQNTGSAGTLAVANGSNLVVRLNDPSPSDATVISGTSGYIDISSGGTLNLVENAAGSAFRDVSVDALQVDVRGSGSKLLLTMNSNQGGFRFNNTTFSVTGGATLENRAVGLYLANSTFDSVDSTLDMGGQQFNLTDSDVSVSGGVLRNFTAVSVSGQGLLSLSDGAQVSGYSIDGSANGRVEIDGQGTVVNLTNATSGIFNVTGGAAVNLGSSFYIPNSITTNLLIDGAGTSFTAKEISKTGVLPGSGNITVANGATLTLTGNSTVWTRAGEFTFNVGAEASNAAAAPGKVIAGQFWAGDQGILDNNAVHLVFNHTDSGYEFSPLLSAQTSTNGKQYNLDVNVVAGRTIFTSDNSYNGGTVIGSNGTLQLGLGGTIGSITGDVVNDGVLAFDRSDRFDFDGQIFGGGRIQQLGSDTLHLNGDSSAFTGLTSVDNGTLMVDGTLGGNILPVVDGNQLGGAGAILGDVNIGSGGILLARSGQVLNIGGNLVLDNNSLTNATLGSPSNVGTVHIAGDLTLGGTLNVESMNGDFGAGTYRIFDYDGTLTNNGYVLGDTAGGDPASMAIQTSVDHQVNLINLTGTPLAFWDGGDVANHGNGKIDGGDGLWTHAANANWTGDQGLINGGWTDGAFAVFNGKAGTVTVDASSGNIVADGMQFAVDGYKVTGDAITLAGNNTPVIRVQDKASAVIESELRGTIGLKKTDYGTLILAADNSYSGGTTVNEGTLQLGNGGDSGSVRGDVVLARTEFDTGRLAFNRSDVFDFNGNISGEGTVFQRGAGTTVLSGNNSYLGGLVVESGTARAGSNTAFGAGRLSVNASGTADLNDIAMTLASINNAGTIRFGVSAGNTLTVSGDYRGNNGALVMNTVFGGDNSKSDRLVVVGDTAGTTTLKFVNQGGAGALTDKGIRVIEVGGNSLGAFELAGDFITSDGQQAVIGGAYAYTLHQNGLDTPADGDWYLRSRSGSNGGGDGPIYNPGVPTYTDGPIVINNINQGGFGGIGSRTHGGHAGGVNDGNDGDKLFRDHYVWGRVEGSFGSYKPNGNVTNSSFDSRDWRMQAGVDGVFNETQAGTIMGSVWLDYINSTADVSASAGDGTINVNGYGFGAGLSWFGDNGFYLDGEGKLTWYRSKYDSAIVNRTVADGVDNFGYALSLEGGRKVSLDERWSMTPQAQLIWSSVKANSYSDVFGSDIETPQNNILTGRIGTAVDYASNWTAADGSATRLTVGGIVNLYQQLNTTAGYITVSGAELATGKVDKTWGELGLTTNYSWLNDKYAVYGKITTAASLSNISDNYTVTGNVGFRVKW